MFSGVSLLEGLDRLPGGKLVQAIIGGIIGLFLAFRSFYFIKDGESGHRTRFGKIIGGKDAKELPPGLVLSVPVFYKVIRVSMLDRTVDLSLLTIQWDVAWEARFVITFNVFKGGVYRALQKNEDLNKHVATVCEHHLWVMLMQLDPNAFTSGELDARLKEAAQAELQEVGVELKTLRLTSANKTYPAQLGQALALASMQQVAACATLPEGNAAE